MWEDSGSDVHRYEVEQLVLKVWDVLELFLVRVRGEQKLIVCCSQKCYSLICARSVSIIQIFDLVA